MEAAAAPVEMAEPGTHVHHMFVTLTIPICTDTLIHLNATTLPQILRARIRCFVITTTIVWTEDDRYEARLIHMHRFD